MAEERGQGKTVDLEEEIGKLRDILSRDPRSRVFPRLAEALRKAGQLDDAVEVCRRGLEQHPDYPGGQVALARALFERGDHGEAEKEISQVVKASPDNLAAQKLMGQIELRMGNREAAEKALNMVLMLEPRDEEARAMLDGIRGGGVSAEAPAPPPTPAAELPAVEEPEEETSFTLEGSDEKVMALPEEEEEPEALVPGVEVGPVEPEAEEFHVAEAFSEELPAEDLPGEEPATGEPPPAESAAGEPTEEEILSSHAGEPVFDLSEMETMAKTAEEEVPEEPEEDESPFEIFTKEPRDVQPAPHEARRGLEDTYEQIFGAEEIGGAGETAAAQPVGEEPASAIPEEEPPLLGAEEWEIAGPAGGEAPVVLDEEVGELDDELSLEEMPLFDMDDEAESPSPLGGEEPEPPEPPPPPDAPEIEPPLMDFEEDLETVEKTEAVTEEEEGKGPFDTATLADLYIGQGFYDKAEEVYLRMLEDRPDDGTLKQKLEEVRSLRTMSPPPPAAAPPEPPAIEEAPTAAGEEETGDEQWEWGAEAPLFRETAAGEEPSIAAPHAAPSGDEGVIEELQRFMDLLKERRG